MKTRRDELYETYLSKSIWVLSNKMDYRFSFHNEETLENMDRETKESLVQLIESLQPRPNISSDVMIPHELIKIWISPGFKYNRTLNNMTMCMSPRTKLTSTLFEQVHFGECVCVYEISPTEHTHLIVGSVEKQFILKRIQDVLRSVDEKIGMDVKGKLSRSTEFKNLSDAYFWKPALSELTKSRIGIYASDDDKHYLVVKTLADKSYNQLVESVKNVLNMNPDITLKEFVKNYPYYDLHLHNCMRNCGQIAQLICQSFNFTPNQKVTKHGDYMLCEPQPISCKYTKSIDITDQITNGNIGDYVSLLDEIVYDKSNYEQNEHLITKTFKYKAGEGLIFLRIDNYKPALYGSHDIKSVDADLYVVESEENIYSVPLINLKEHNNFGVNNFVSIPSSIPVKRKNEVKEVSKTKPVSLLKRTLSKQEMLTCYVSTKSSPCTPVSIDNETDGQYYDILKNISLRHYPPKSQYVEPTKIHPIILIK